MKNKKKLSNQKKEEILKRFIFTDGEVINAMEKDFGESKQKECYNCNRSVEFSSLFCPNCGVILFPESLIYEKSTENFNPKSVEFKPWRDKPLIPERKYPKAQPKNKPWYPTMKQSHISRKKVVEEKNISQEDENVYLMKMTLANSNVIKAKYSIDLESIDEVDFENEHEKLTKKSQENNEFKVKVRPVSVYEAVWLPGCPFIHISLIIQKFGDYKKLFWMKLGIIENIDDHVNLEARFEKLISNDLGGMLVNSIDEWVNLDSIDATEYYMANHMQRILIDLAHHITFVCYKRFLSSKIYSIESTQLNSSSSNLISESAKSEQDHYGDSLSYKNENFVNIEMRCLNHTESKHYVEENICRMAGFNFGMFDYFLSISYRVKEIVERRRRKVLVKIYLSVDYQNAIERNKYSSSISLKSFDDSKKATGLRIKICPMDPYYPEGILSLDRSILSILMKEALDLDQLLNDNDFFTLRVMLRKIGSFLSIQYSEKGELGYVLAGTSSSPSFISI